MRTEPIASCERDFILNSFAKNVRIDGRGVDEYRDVKIVVGSQFGSALAMVGKTKVFAQISCSLVEPRSARGNAGTVEVDVDMSLMASPAHELDRLGSKGIELTRILELLIRDSNMLDLESLCVRSNRQVWQIHADVHVLDCDAALIDCAVLATVTALAHFRRPEITVQADAVIIHGPEEKMCVPLNIYHMPICVTFGMTDNCEGVVLDPNEREEQCLSGSLVVAVNKRREICALHQSGVLSMRPIIVKSCVEVAIQRAIDISELITSVIRDDALKRSERTGNLEGFAQLIALDVLTSHRCEPNELIAPAIKRISIESLLNENTGSISSAEVININSEKSPLLGEVDVGRTRNMEHDEELMEHLADIIASGTSTAPADLHVDEEMDKVNELLDGIEEEIVELREKEKESTSEASQTNTERSGKEHSGFVNLSAAVKKKKPKK
ncbi:hypothetical protein AB6A40_006081 [Gnathostoma spinigerum]|uniref:Exosome complex component RRP45 n=1 Tax=Gnathostoma spinigerum TaxID=75299 RepID=A0ABD6ES44_9BILA